MRLVMRLGTKYLLAALLVATPAAAQTDDDEWLRRCQQNSNRNDRQTACEVRVERMAASAALAITPGSNGGVAIHGWDRNEVEVHARIRGDAETADAAQAMAKGVTLALQAGSISADGPQPGRRENWSVQFVVFAPRNTKFTAESQNGPMSAEGVHGGLDLRTQNGPLSLRNVSGAVRARTLNGPLSVELTGTRWEGTGLDAETQNGPVTLVVPENYSAELETGTVHGPISSDFPITMRLEGQGRMMLGRDIRTTLGSGGAPVRVRTTNGPVSLKRPRV